MAKIMIVDDSLTERRIIRSLLQENTSHTIVAEAMDGEDAIHKYKRYKPDLVTMDLNMPEMNGIDLLKVIREKTPATEVIMVTAYASVDTATEALRLGAVDYLLSCNLKGQHDFRIKQCSIET